MTYSADDRAAAIAQIIEGLSKGTPLTVLCAGDGMPAVSTFYDWVEADRSLSVAIARARELGFDAIALEALVIADTQSRGEVRTTKADGTVEIKEEDMLGHRKLQVDTRLKLLAKWDPKRYGDATTVKHADANGEAIKPDEMTTVTRLAAICLAISQQQPPDAPD